MICDRFKENAELFLHFQEKVKQYVIELELRELNLDQDLNSNKNEKQILIEKFKDWKIKFGFVHYAKASVS